MKLGIGVITYNRRQRVLKTIAALREHTKLEASFVVADDGSQDGTVNAIRLAYPDLPIVTGKNTGVCHNRNRALWWLHVEERCDCVILIEDDTFPVATGWEVDWVAAASLYGHINLDGI